MKKQKALLPSLREKKRYITIEVITAKPAGTAHEISNSISASLRMFLGTQGAAKAGIIFLADQYDSKRQRGILRVAHHSVDAVKGALCLCTTISGQPAIMRSMLVSGMLHKAKTAVQSA